MLHQHERLCLQDGRQEEVLTLVEERHCTPWLPHRPVVRGARQVLRGGNEGNEWNDGAKLLGSSYKRKTVIRTRRS